MTSPRPHHFVRDLAEIDSTDLTAVGGKAANLGELTRIDGIRVPAGFCVTTDAFTQALRSSTPIPELLTQLKLASPDDRLAIVEICAEIRQIIEHATIPNDVGSEITAAVQRLGERAAYAVRSSATAEDSPTASFAGQHDSYLNVVGTRDVLDHVRRCWASLFTERAVTYRAHHGIDHQHVRMAVIVQQMVDAQAAGVMFTAHPVTSNRTVCTLEATFGLGEALVSGAVNADVYTISDDGRVEASLATKAMATAPSPGGGTQQIAVETDRQETPALTEEQIRNLVSLGRRIEAHFATPQDIEWCLMDDDVWIVQSRPITTLFPIPPVTDGANHVWVSVGHQQMMTDPMKPLGLSFWQKTTPAPMAEAASRLFVDVTAQLASPSSRTRLLDVLGRSDPLIRDALQTIIDRGDFIEPIADESGAPVAPWASATTMLDPDPTIVDDLIAHWQTSIIQLRRDIATRSGTELFEFIAHDIVALRGLLFDQRSLGVIMTAIDATRWLDEHLTEWLGDRNAAGTLTLSAPNNVTSEMGLALLDVADAIRPHRTVVEYLERNGRHDDTFLDALESLPGGSDARIAIERFLYDYGMRCVGEIDITRPRWVEQPGALVPVILGHIHNAKPGEAKRRFEQGRRGAQAKEDEILAGLRSLPDGDAKATETKQMIDRVRTFIGYREYPKYAWICRYLEYKRALLSEAEQLREIGVIDDVDDISYLTFDELHDAVRNRLVDSAVIAARKASFEVHETLSPPRVLTSDGEKLTGRYHRNDLPAGALAGLAVSAGVVEGRARVIHDMSHADVEPGDILVTAHTDPSWSPLFVAISGLVTEVGGVMTHGAVVAREYGLPAVVGVQGATHKITDGQRIRLNGTDGYVEILSP
ncbi:MAG: rifamycin-inactivating phosphotransferase [Ilumatobacteraceae bacterium]